MTRVLVGTIKIHGKDDESGRDEIMDHEPLNVVLNLEEGGDAKTLLAGKWRWGGECRLEALVSAQVIGDNVVAVFGDAKLYEGASENSNDLDGQESINFFIPPFSSENQAQTVSDIVVNNTDEGGDYGQITFRLQNF